MATIKDITIDNIHPLRRDFSVKIEELIVDDNGNVLGIAKHVSDDPILNGVPKRDRCAFMPGQYDYLTRYLAHHGLTDENQQKLIMDSVNALWTPEIIESYRSWEQAQAEEENRLRDIQLAEELQREEQRLVQQEAQKQALIDEIKAEILAEQQK